MNPVCVTTGSRLHFGLVRLPPASAWIEDGRRYFGGIGMMIDEPGVRVVVERSADWSASGPLGERALAAARRFRAASGDPGPAAIRVERAIFEHAGLGAGTQLELAVAAAIAAVFGIEADAASLAMRVGRGARSAIGIHGFAHGGLIVDAGKTAPGEIAPAANRLVVPESWRVVLALDSRPGSWSGPRERAAFEAARPDGALADRLERLIAAAIVPAVARADLQGFGEALSEYNRLAGEYFRDAQGGTFAGPDVAATIEVCRQAGVTACGQTSWGPTVFAIAKADEAEGLQRRLACRSPERSIRVAQPLNRGARIAHGARDK